VTLYIYILFSINIYIYSTHFLSVLRHKLAYQTVTTPSPMAPIRDAIPRNKRGEAPKRLKNPMATMFIGGVGVPFSRFSDFRVSSFPVWLGRAPPPHPKAMEKAAGARRACHEKKERSQPRNPPSGRLLTSPSFTSVAAIPDHLFPPGFPRSSGFRV